MNFSPFKGLLLKGVPLFCGSTGVSIGGWQCYGGSANKIGNVFSSRRWINASNLDINYSSLDSYKEEIASKDNSCYSLYFKKSPFNISADKLSKPSNEKTVDNTEGAVEELNLISEYDYGCVIFRSDWSEMILWNKNSSKSILLYFSHTTILEVFIFNSEKTGEIKSSQLYKWEDIYDIDFIFENKEINETDWILENGKDIKIAITVPTNAKAKIEIKGNGWKNRDEFCNEIKNSPVTDDAIKKTEKWCLVK